MARADGQPSKGELTRSRLVEVAAQVFAEHGYSATTYEQLVQATGLSRGAFYFHFPSKEKLAVEVLRRTKDRWLAQVSQRVAGAGDAAAALREFGPALIELHLTDPAGWVASGLARESATGSELRAAAADVTRSWLAAIAELVRAAQAQGGVRADLDAEQVALVLYAAVDGLHTLADLLVDEPHRQAGFAAQVAVLRSVLDGGLFRA